MSVFFEIKNLNISFKVFGGENNILNIEHLSIEKGETFGLVGESGAGKTVLALAILKLLPQHSVVIHSGEIWFDGQNLLEKTMKQIQRQYLGKRIAMIFQDPMSTLNPVFTVGKQIGRVLHQHHGYKGRDLNLKAAEALDMVKLPDAYNILGKYPHELSGGQRQRIIIAIALSCGAEFLIADEPTRNLDVTIQAGILKLIDELQKSLNISVLFIANNMGLVNVICKKIGIMYFGKIVEMGMDKDVISNSSHPYTSALLSAIPREKNSKLMFASVPVRESIPGACVYYSRCSKAIDKCKTMNPPLRYISDLHQVACILDDGREI